MHFVKAFEVVAYTYRADIYCAECVLGAVIEAIDATGVVFGGAVHGTPGRSALRASSALSSINDTPDVW